MLNPKSNKDFGDLKQLANVDGTLGKIISSIAKYGEVKPFEWKKIKTLILFMMRQTIISINDEKADCKTAPGECFDDLLEGILQYFTQFEDK